MVMAVPSPITPLPRLIADNLHSDTVMGLCLASCGLNKKSRFLWTRQPALDGNLSAGGTRTEKLHSLAGEFPAWIVLHRIKLTEVVLIKLDKVFTIMTGGYIRWEG